MFSFIQKIHNNLSAPRKLQEATALVAQALGQAGYPERVQDVYDNIKANESLLALENLCENLFEFSCPVPERAYELLEEAGTIMNVEKKYWEMLKPLVVKVKDR